MNKKIFTLIAAFLAVTFSVGTLHAAASLDITKVNKDGYYALKLGAGYLTVGASDAVVLEADLAKADYWKIKSEGKEPVTEKPIYSFVNSKGKALAFEDKVGTPATIKAGKAKFVAEGDVDAGYNVSFTVKVGDETQATYYFAEGTGVLAFAKTAGTKLCIEDAGLTLFDPTTVNQFGYFTLTADIAIANNPLTGQALRAVKKGDYYQLVNVADGKVLTVDAPYQNISNTAVGSPYGATLSFATAADAKADFQQFKIYKSEATGKYYLEAKDAPKKKADGKADAGVGKPIAIVYANVGDSKAVAAGTDNVADYYNDGTAADGQIGTLLPFKKPSSSAPVEIEEGIYYVKDQNANAIGKITVPVETKVTQNEDEVGTDVQLYSDLDLTLEELKALFEEHNAQYVNGYTEIDAEADDAKIAGYPVIGTATITGQNFLQFGVTETEFSETLVALNKETDVLADPENYDEEGYPKTTETTGLSYTVDVDIEEFGDLEVSSSDQMSFIGVKGVSSGGLGSSDYNYFINAYNNIVFENGGAASFRVEGGGSYIAITAANWMYFDFVSMSLVGDGVQLETWYDVLDAFIVSYADPTTAAAIEIDDVLVENVVVEFNEFDQTIADLCGVVYDDVVAYTNTNDFGGFTSFPLSFADAYYADAYPATYEGLTFIYNKNTPVDDGLFEEVSSFEDEIAADNAEHFVPLVSYEKEFEEGDLNVDLTADNAATYLLNGETWAGEVAAWNEAHLVPQLDWTTDVVDYSYTEEVDGVITNPNKGKYYGETTGDYMDKVNPLLPQGQWVVKATDKKYAIGSRMAGASENAKYYIDGFAGKQIYKDGENYTFDFVNYFSLEKATEVDATNKFLGVQEITPDDILLNKYALRIYSTIADDTNVYAQAKEGAVNAKVIDREDAYNYEVKLYEYAPGVYAQKIRGAQKLGDDLYVCAIALKEPFGDKSVVIGDEKLEFAAGGRQFYVLESNGVADQYFLVPFGQDDDVVVANLTTTDLTVVAKEDADAAGLLNLFALESTDAPTYASYEHGHKNFTEIGALRKLTREDKEGDAEGDAVLMTEEAGYTPEQFGLYLEEAVQAETPQYAMDVYFILTENGLEEGETAFLVDNNGSAATADFLTAEYTKTFNEGTYDLSGQTIKVSETVSYTAATLQNNPAAVAFMNTEVEGQVMIQNLKTKRFLRVDNNIVYWTNNPANALLFNVSDAVATPSGNEEVSVSDVKVQGGNGIVTIKGAEGKTVQIANVAGQVLVNTNVASDEASYSVAAGVIFVTVDGETFKVLVK